MSKLLDISSFGLKPSLIKGAKVFGYHVFSAGVVAILATIATELGKLNVSHPEYAVYVAASIAVVNTVSVVIVQWLKAINPDHVIEVTSVPVVEEQVPEQPLAV